MDGEAGWWTTSGNIGLPPPARVMGVGRQQHQAGWTVSTLSDPAGVPARLARWTEKLAGGPQAGTSDSPHQQGSWEWVDNNIKLDGQSVTSPMDVKSKVKSLPSLRKSPLANEKKMQLDSLKLFNRLIIFAQRDMTFEASLQYELTPFPMSLFNNNDQKMNKSNKADFSKTSLKALTDPIDLTNQPCSTLVIDGEWLHGEVGTTSDLAGDRQQLAELRAVSRPLLPEDHCGL